MACNDCGSCRYSNNSTATVSIKITSGGFQPACRPNRESLYAGLPYQGPGLWSTTYTNGNTVTASSSCRGASWTWSETKPPPPPDPLRCPQQAIEQTVTQTHQDNCAGFHQVETSTYPNGSWITVEVKITVENNAECE